MSSPPRCCLERGEGSPERIRSPPSEEVGPHRRGPDAPWRMPQREHLGLGQLSATRRRPRTDAGRVPQRFGLRSHYPVQTPVTPSSAADSPANRSRARNGTSADAGDPASGELAHLCRYGMDGHGRKDKAGQADSGLAQPRDGPKYSPRQESRLARPARAAAGPTAVRVEIPANTPGWSTYAESPSIMRRLGKRLFLPDQGRAAGQHRLRGVRRRGDRSRRLAHAEITTRAPSAHSRCGECRAGPGGVRVPDPHYLTTC
jgi:hypothetical protein